MNREISRRLKPTPKERAREDVGIEERGREREGEKGWEDGKECGGVEREKGRESDRKRER
jgi:hypothetical protein